ncbi:MAG: hypothetical protein ACRD19_01370 [Terriglobia bacterium]
MGNSDFRCAIEISGAVAAMPGRAGFGMVCLEGAPMWRRVS